jgi:hypothetical protein
MLDEPFEVIRELVVELAVDAATGKERTRAEAQHGEPSLDRHFTPPAA